LKKKSKEMVHDGHNLEPEIGEERGGVREKPRKRGEKKGNQKYRKESGGLFWGKRPNAKNKARGRQKSNCQGRDVSMCREKGARKEKVWKPSHKKKRPNLRHEGEKSGNRNSQRGRRRFHTFKKETKKVNWTLLMEKSEKGGEPRIEEKDEPKNQWR